jgi:hypothetical protein
MQTKESMMAKMKREQIDVFLGTLVYSAQKRHGMTSGLAYAAGFFQSQLAAMLVDAPAAKQMEVINLLIQRSLED